MSRYTEKEQIALSYLNSHPNGVTVKSYMQAKKCTYVHANSAFRSLRDKGAASVHVKKPNNEHVFKPIRGLTIQRPVETPRISQVSAHITDPRLMEVLGYLTDDRLVSPYDLQLMRVSLDEREQIWNRGYVVRKHGYFRISDDGKDMYNFLKTGVSPSHKRTRRLPKNRETSSD